MSTIVTRAGKGSPLTNTELDSNFSNLNTDKLELSGGSLTGNLSLGTNNKAIFNSQLEIYGDGSHSYISDVGTGNLIIKGTHLNLRDANNTLYMEALQGGAVTLRHAGNISVATTSTGIDVTGSVVADGVQSTDGNIKVTTLGSFVGFNSQRAGVPSSGGYQLGRLNFDAYSTGTTFVSGASIQSYSDGAAWTSSSTPAYLSFQTTPSGSTSLKERIKVASNGDISFYNDSAAQGLFWDSSTSRLGLGVTNPASLLHLSGANGSGRLELQNTWGTTVTNWRIAPIISGVSNNGFEIRDVTQGVSRFVINSSGNASFSGAVSATKAGYNANGSAWAESAYASSGSYGGGYSIIDGSAGFLLHAQSSGTQFVIRQGTVGSNPSTLLTMNSSGNLNLTNGSLMVGATTAPTDKLEIRGNAKIEQTSNVDAILRLNPNSGTIGSNYRWELVGGNSAASYGFQIREGTTPYLTINNSAGGNAGNATFSGSVTSTGNTTIKDAGVVRLKAAPSGSLYGGGFDVFSVTGSNTSPYTSTTRFGNYGQNEVMVLTGANVNIPNGSLMVGATTAPSYKLAIRDDSASAYPLSLESGTIGTAGNHTGIRFGFTGNTYQKGAIIFEGQDANGRGKMYFAMEGSANSSNADETDAKMTIDYLGNVGIGTSSPTMPLSVKAASNAYAINMHGRSDGYSEIYGSSSDGSTRYAFLQTHSAQTKLYTLVNTPLLFGTNSTERMRLSGGNLLVGTTDTTIYNNLSGDGGIVLAKVTGGGRIDASRAGSCYTANRLGSDGQLFDFRKNGGIVGRISTVGNDLVIGSSVSGHKGVRFGSSYIAPINTSDAFEDNTTDLGLPAVRFKDLYLSNNATAQKLTLTKAPVGTYTIEVDGTNTGQPNLIVKQSTSERLRIDNLGRVGIGTSNPYGLMHCQDSSTINLIGTNSGADGQTDTTVLSLIGQARGYNNNLPKLASIDFKTDPTTWYKGNITFNVANSDGTDPSLTPLEAMRIDSSGSVGIGNINPNLPLTVTSNSGANAIAIRARSADDYGFMQFYNNAGTALRGQIYNQNGALGFTTSTSGTPRMLIDTSGNLLVGTTSVSTATQGIKLRSDIDAIAAVADGQISGYFGRLNSDGDILNFRKDSTTVGSIGTHTSNMFIGSVDSGLYFDSTNNRISPYYVNNNSLPNGGISLGGNSNRFQDLYLSGTANVQYAGATDTGIYFNGSFNAVVPYRPDTGVAVDDYLDLGVYSHRWDDIFATNGTIQTSDRNEKQDIEDLTEAEERVAVAAKGLLKKFRWKSAVEDKGDDARIHFGIIAQDLQDAFEAEGLDAGRYGMFTSNTWTNEDGEEQTRMGVRYSELLAFIISAI